MAFKDIRGHKRFISLLQRAIVSNRIANGYLFTGPESAGKRYIALNFVKALNCKNPLYDDNGLPDCCDKCISCIKINNDSHPDVKIIDQDGDSIKIEQIKELIEKSQFMPTAGRWQSIIIDDAETMTTEAANCLLKLLEEPPDYMTFILISSNMFLLLPTIVSRCQIHRFELLPADTIREILETRYRISPEKSSLYASISNGKIERALRLFQKKGFEEFRENLINMLRGKSENYIWKVITEQDKICLERFDYRKSEKTAVTFHPNELYLLFEFMLIWYRDLLVFKELENGKIVINADKCDIIKNEVNNIAKEEILSKINDLYYARDSIKKNVNIRLVLENLLMTGGDR